MVTGASPPSKEEASAWFTGGPGVDPAGQIAVYREQYRLRHLATLGEALPATAHLAGDRFEELGLAYLHDRPPTDWTLDRLGDGFPSWLADRGAAADLCEAAAVDMAVHRAGRAAAAPVLPVETLTEDKPLTWSPGVAVLTLGAPWHDYRRAVCAGQRPRPPGSQHQIVAVYRVDNAVTDRRLDPWEAALLRQFEQPHTVTAAVEAIVAAGAPAGLLQRSLGGWFRRFAERRLLRTTA